MAVRSRRFTASVSLAPGSNGLLASCPTGRTAIIRYACVHNRTGVAATGQMWVRTPGGAFITVARSSLADEGLLTLSTFLVLNPGDDLIGSVTGTAGTFTGYAAGALLDGVSS